MELFTASDLELITQRGGDPEMVEKQFSHFKKGFPFAHLHDITTPGNGMINFDDETLHQLVLQYDQYCNDLKIVRFVPASGAATRMFKELYEALSLEDGLFSPKVNHFFAQIKQFAFYEDLKPYIQNKDKKGILKALLSQEGLDYGNKPKGLLQFHRYDGMTRTALEEHLVESALYAVSKDRTCYLHFTVSPAHQDGFLKRVQSVQSIYEQKYHVKYEISYSIQDPATDTLAAELDNTPFRDADGHLLFRPGGHGALISNLNAIKADLIFVKNIDNVTKEDRLLSTITFKKACAALLISLQNTCFSYLNQLEKGDINIQMLEKITQFAKEKLNIHFLTNQPTQEELKNALNRPIRVCGMVKNQGEPGGGPFWVKDKNGVVSCQIVESSQINMKDPIQKAIFDRSTHFNPVDMVCSTIDYKGNYFNLHDFVDEETGFISEKSYEGRTLKAMELPGLWNGAMAHWITVFVEVPLETFNPVKTIFDLLKR